MMALQSTLISCWLLLHINDAAGKSDIVRIGAIFDEPSLREEQVFRAAIEAINGNRKLLAHSRLSAIIETVKPGDSMAAYKKACAMLQTGVAAIFAGSTDGGSVQTACDHLEVPLLMARWQNRRPPFAINLHPPPSTLAAAYRSVLQALGWQDLVVVCDSSEGLLRVKELLKDDAFRVTLRDLPRGLDYRELLKAIKLSGIVHILLEVHRSKIHSLLKQAQQIGLMTAYHHYFITSLDLHTVDLEDFKYSGTNTTALRLINLSDGTLQQILRDWSADLDDSGNIFGGEIVSTELALVYDAVQLFARALSDLDKTRAIEVLPLNCSKEQ
ncbi:glutamate receptor ionotropic, kainate 2-like, partial [Hyalella azteca]|uniref:Glutamate receptor ionotropic, kainate 2-like n=1 Tax=Hyalella azteca TaxID=294128 RepID=A0A979FG17_HYAAZ